MPTTMEQLTTLVDTHLEAYGEPDSTRRSELLGRVWAEDGRLVDPPAVGEGHAGISGLADALQQQFADHRFRRTTAVDAHNDAARYAWELVGPDRAVVLEGLDVAQVGRDGRLVQITGFFGDLAPKEATA